MLAGACFPPPHLPRFIHVRSQPADWEGGREGQAVFWGSHRPPDGASRGIKTVTLPRIRPCCSVPSSPSQSDRMAIGCGVSMS